LVKVRFEDGEILAANQVLVENSAALARSKLLKPANKQQRLLRICVFVPFQNLGCQFDALQRRLHSGGTVPTLPLLPPPFPSSLLLLLLLLATWCDFIERLMSKVKRVILADGSARSDGLYSRRDD